MEIKILEDSVYERLKEPYYILEINFMECDGSGEQTETIEFPIDELEKHKSLIIAAECCCKLGLENGNFYIGMPDYDAFFGVTEEPEPDINPLGIFIEHPVDSNGERTTFDYYELTYVDENGSTFETEIIFSEKEIEYINKRLKNHGKFE